MDQQRHRTGNPLWGDIPEPENYILPFFWMKRGMREDLPGRIRAVYDSGVRALCLESRTHEDFCGPDWWGDLEVIFREAEALGMKVWILDDKRFPTGYANGLVAKKYPERRKWQVIEHHVDVIGPQRQVSLLLPAKFREDVLLGIRLWERTGRGEALRGEPVDLTGSLAGDFVTFDVPEGLWRAFFFFQSRKGTRQEDYIHLIDEESVRVLIEAVYEPHYARLRPYFGNVFAGFFSDEPSLGNGPFANTVLTTDWKNFRPGMPGLALPWSDRLREELDDATGGRALDDLALLWYPAEDREGTFRYHYMDVLTARYRDAFSRQLGDWCRERGVEYIGHIIEDMNAHGRTGCSAGHYFRSLDGQDMSGMDIVLHQILPGFGHWQNSAICSGGVVDPDFYHYVLAKLCASMARLNPRTKGRALCEVFGAYGWAEGAPMMKWLVDHLLVRGINHFVPHAYSPDFPNPDCPPHFDAGGNDPQYPGFCALMGYANRMAGLLYGAKPVSRLAVLYHGENEWMNGEDRMLMQVPAKRLTEAWIEFELVPADYLEAAAYPSPGVFAVNGVEFRCLVIPYARRLPPPVARVAARLREAGVPVYMVGDDRLPADCDLPAISLEELVPVAESHGCRTIQVSGRGELLRIGQFRREDGLLVMLFNESVTQASDVTLGVPGAKTCASANLLTGEEWSGPVPAEGIPVRLEPYESRLLWINGSGAREERPSRRLTPIGEVTGPWAIGLMETGKDSAYRPAGPDSLVNITGPDHFPDFSGVVRYEASLRVDGETEGLSLDLGEVGMVSRLEINGRDLGLRICRPYRYFLGDALRQGENTIVVEVANTLVHRVKDSFSPYLAIPPSGLLGPVCLLREEAEPGRK